MLDVGTKVSIQKLYKDDRPTHLPSGRKIRTSYTTSCSMQYISEYIGQGYYTVKHGEYSMDVSGIVHEDEMVNMETYEPKFKVGDMVRICDISDEEKSRYLVGWVDEMDNCVGQTARVIRVCNYPDTYHLEDTWKIFGGTGI